MTKKIRSLAAILTLGVLAFLSLASGVPSPFIQFTPTATATPTLGPKARAAALLLESQAGRSDGVVLLGFLLFIFIVVPIILRYRNLKRVQ